MVRPNLILKVKLIKKYWLKILLRTLFVIWAFYFLMMLTNTGAYMSNFEVLLIAAVVGAAAYSMGKSNVSTPLEMEIDIRDERMQELIEEVKALEEEAEEKGEAMKKEIERLEEEI